MIEAEGWKAGADGIYEKDGQRLALTMYTNSGNKGREALLQGEGDLRFTRRGLLAPVESAKGPYGIVTAPK